MFEIGKIYKNSHNDELVKIIYRCKRTGDYIGVLHEEYDLRFDKDGRRLTQPHIRLTEEYREPTNYSVELYLPGSPKKMRYASHLGYHLLGFSSFSEDKRPGFETKVSVTVKEISCK